MKVAKQTKNKHITEIEEVLNENFEYQIQLAGLKQFKSKNHQTPGFPII